MPEYLDDPTVLTKDKLKSELLAHNVELPSGNPTKDVYVQLYLKNLTAQKGTVTAVTLDAFSSDDELPPPVISSRSRSSGRKATRKTDKVKPDELLRLGVDVGPTLDPTPKLYEKKLQNLFDSHALQPELVLTEVQVNHNGNAEPDLYSDKEDEITEAAETPESGFVEKSEPAPVVESTLRNRGKSPGTNPILSSQHHMVEKISASSHDSKVEENDNDINSPTNITATCRRPIKGAASRPIKSSDLWNDENFLFSPNTTKTTSSSSFYSESHVVNRVNNLPPSTSSLSTSFRPLSVAPASANTKAASHSMSLWMKFFLVAVVAAFLFLVYYTMETNSINPFATTETEASSGSIE